MEFSTKVYTRINHNIFFKQQHKAAPFLYDECLKS